MFYRRITISKYPKQYGKLEQTNRKEVFYQQLIIIFLFLSLIAFKVALQMPEGLLLYACTIADIIQE
jgi:diphthamide synthase subunit DPH2